MITGWVTLWVCHKCGFDNYGPLTVCQGCKYRLKWLKKGETQIGR